MRQSIKRAAANRRLLGQIKKEWKNREPNLGKLQSLIDKAAQRKIIHPNRAARFKSRLYRVAKA